MKLWVFLVVFAWAGTIRAGSFPDSLIRAMAESEGHRLVRVESSRIHPVEDSLYHPKSISTYIFKAKKRLPRVGSERYYFTYTASLLDFPDTVLAAKRLDSVRAFSTPEERMMKTTRYGFRIGAQVVFLTVHPVLFEEPLRKLALAYRHKGGVKVVPNPRP